MGEMLLAVGHNPAETMLRVDAANAAQFYVHASQKQNTHMLGSILALHRYNS